MSRSKMLILSLDSIKDGAHDAGPELYGERFAGPEHRVADGDAGSLFVNLRGVTRVYKTQVSSDVISVKSAL